MGMNWNQGPFSIYSNSISYKTKDTRSYGNYWSPIQKEIDRLGSFESIYLSNDGVYHKVNLLGLLNPETNQFCSGRIKHSIDFQYATSVI